MDVAVYYREDQAFRRGFAWALLLLISLAFIGILLLGIVEVIDPDAPWFPQVMANKMAVGFGVILTTGYLLIIFIFMSLRLQVEVNSAGLFLRFIPFHRALRQIDLRGIESVTPVTYRPVRDYGGYGIRYVRHGKAFNVRGTSGVRLDYENGYHMLIGSQQAESFAAALQHHIDLYPPGPLDDDEEWDEEYEDVDEDEVDRNE
jgi:hypothetical protein